MTALTIEQAQQLLTQNFAPWIQQLGIHFDTLTDGTLTLSIPATPQLNREGGSLCGQAVMALADTAMVFAVCGAVGAYVPMTTVSQSTSFLRAPTGPTLFARARIIKKGRTLMYGEVTLYTDNSEKPVAHVTSTYMLL